MFCQLSFCWQFSYFLNFSHTSSCLDVFGDLSYGFVIASASFWTIFLALFDSILIGSWKTPTFHQMRCRLSKLLPSKLNIKLTFKAPSVKRNQSQPLNMIESNKYNPCLPWGAKFQNSWVYMMFCGLVTECRGIQSKNGQRTIYTDSYRRQDRWCLQCLSILLSRASVSVSLHSVITFNATLPKWVSWNYEFS